MKNELLFTSLFIIYIVLGIQFSKTIIIKQLAYLLHFTTNWLQTIVMDMRQTNRQWSH